MLSDVTIVHRGPCADGHLKLHLRDVDGGVHSVDLVKNAHRLLGHDWGASMPLAAAHHAYPRSGHMYPTTFRFLPYQTDVTVPQPAAAPSEVLRSSAGSPCTGSGWLPLREGVTLQTAFEAFVRLASTRWCNVDLYNCRSFVHELLGKFVSDAAVAQAFDKTFRYVVLERRPYGRMR